MNQFHPRYQHTLDDLFLHVFVLIDDFLQPFESHLPRQAHQKAGISEILTIAIVGEILYQPFESVWYWLVKQNHQDPFPSLPHPSRYHRILRNSERLIAQLALSVTSEQSGPAPRELKTPEALAVVGPGAFGYPEVPFSPLPGDLL